MFLQAVATFALSESGMGAFDLSFDDFFARHLARLGVGAVTFLLASFGVRGTEQQGLH